MSRSRSRVTWWLGGALLAMACRSGGSAGIDPGARPVPRRPAPAQSGPAADALLYDPARGTVTLDDLERLRERILAVPVEGKYPADVGATFSDGRSAGRRHNAAD
ncbi:MAG TPA: hypothetical protein VE861_03490, partial [Gemmatimonadaceae bacterium]|nr:hypothetical protein [Gemmatimonadaceae bacterium]